MTDLENLIDKNVGWKINDLLQELQIMRLSQIRPATKYLGNSIQEQFNHMISEINEVEEELYPAYANPIYYKKLVEEIIDLQFSCQTMLEGPLKQTKEQIAVAIQKVVEKNKARYYDK